MPPQSRGDAPKAVPSGFQSKSTPNLPTLRSLDAGSGALPSGATSATSHPEQPSPDIITSPSEPASLDDFSLDSHDQPSLSPASTEDEDSEEDSSVGNLPTRPIYHHHSKSHTYLGPSAFAPPFYNRPPTPLPPSPSLSSLLIRPNFSTHNSRPGTPDPSSDEGTQNTHDGATGTQTPNSAAASTLTSTFRTAKPIPRASPKVPTYEYYGFTLYLVSSLVFIVYILWAYLPSPFLHQLGIYYYPNRWWALAIPAWVVMLVVYIYVALASYNTGYLTLSMDSVECLVDEAANVAVVDAAGKLVAQDEPSWGGRGGADAKHVGHGHGRKGGKGKHGGRSRRGSLTSKAHVFSQDTDLDWRTLWNEGTDAVMDIPLGGVCEILYGSYAAGHEDVRGNAHDR